VSRSSSPVSSLDLCEALKSTSFRLSRDCDVTAAAAGADITAADAQLLTEVRGWRDFFSAGGAVSATALVA